MTDVCLEWYNMYGRQSGPGGHHNGGGCSALTGGAEIVSFPPPEFSGKEAVPMNKIESTGADMVSFAELFALLTLKVGIVTLVVMIMRK